jgi:phosphotransferase system  glucose/maltose/N-acetylglucosamine-specific IIC component
MLIGSLSSGGALDYFTTGTQPTLVRHWTGFWMTSSVAAFVLFLVFAVFFRGGGMIRSREPDL